MNKKGSFFKKIENLCDDICSDDFHSKCDGLDIFWLITESILSIVLILIIILAIFGIIK